MENEMILDKIGTLAPETKEGLEFAQETLKLSRAFRATKQDQPEKSDIELTKSVNPYISENVYGFVSYFK